MVSSLFKLAFARLVEREARGGRVESGLTCSFCHFAFEHGCGSHNEG